MEGDTADCEGVPQTSAGGEEEMEMEKDAKQPEWTDGLATLESQTAF